MHHYTESSLLCIVELILIIMLHCFAESGYDVYLCTECGYSVYHCTESSYPLYCCTECDYYAALFCYDWQCCVSLYCVVVKLCIILLSIVMLKWLRRVSLY